MSTAHNVAALQAVLNIEGVEARIGHAVIRVLHNEADSTADPYMTDIISGAPRPDLALALLSELKENGLWPLPVEQLVIDQQSYRILRAKARRGEVLMILREEGQ